MAHRSPTSRALVVLVAFLVLLSVVPAPVAADARMGGAVVVGAGETVDGLSVVAGTVVVRGTVDGDVSGAAGTLVIAESATVTGDVAVSAGSVAIDGTVEGTVSGAAGSLSVGETGVVGGPLDVGAGSVVIDGTVVGDATIGTDQLVLGATADLRGDLTVDDGTTIDRDPAATVAGTVARENLGGVALVDWPGADLAGTAWSMIASLLLGAVLLLAFPRFSERVTETVADQPGHSAAVGLVTLLVVPLVLLALVVTIVGIPLVLFLGVPLVVIGTWIAAVYGRIAVGAWLLARADTEDRWLALVVGVVGIGLLAMAPILGGLLEIAVFLLGLGALADQLWGRWRGRRSTPPEAERAPGDGTSDAHPT